MRRNLDKLNANDYFINEPQIFHKLRGLRNLLTSQSFEREIASQVDRPISYKARRFFTKREVDFFSRDDKQRYIQTKENRKLSLTTRYPIPHTELNQDLFDDDSHRSSKATFEQNT